RDDPRYGQPGDARAQALLRDPRVGRRRKRLPREAQARVPQAPEVRRYGAARELSPAPNSCRVATSCFHIHTPTATETDKNDPRPGNTEYLAGHDFALRARTP